MVEGEQRDMIAEAKAAAEELRKEREELVKVYKEYQESKSREILGGKTSAGEPQKPVLTEAEKIHEENKTLFKGTVLEGLYK